MAVVNKANGSFCAAKKDGSNGIVLGLNELADTLSPSLSWPLVIFGTEKLLLYSFGTWISKSLSSKDLFSYKVALVLFPRSGFTFEEVLVGSISALKAASENLFIPVGLSGFCLALCDIGGFVAVEGFLVSISLNLETECYIFRSLATLCLTVELLIESTLSLVCESDDYCESFSSFTNFWNSTNFW